MTALNVAIAEDNPKTMELLNDMLKNEDGIEVVGNAETGDEAYKMIVTSKPDVVLLDVIMPGMDGVELAKKIREQNRDIAIVFTTGMTDYLQEGYEVAALHYLVKPLEKAKVWDCMERICGRQESGKSHIFMLEAEVEETEE